jgi:hypothetical protein
MDSLATFIATPSPTPPEKPARFDILLHDSQSVDDLKQLCAARLPDTPVEVTPIFDHADTELSRSVMLTFPDHTFNPDDVHPHDVAHDLHAALSIVDIAPWDTGLEAPLAAALPPGEPDIDPDEIASEEDHEWHLKQLRLPEAWNYTKGNGVLIGQPDTGYADHHLLTHAIERRKGCNILGGPDDYPDDPLKPLPFYFGGHGVSVASTAASRGFDAHKRVRGAAPAAKVLPVRCVDSVVINPGSAWDVARAIVKAVDEGAHVISMSLGGVPGLGGLIMMDRAMAYGLRHSVIFVAAAGNLPGPVVYPAINDACTSVGGSIKEETPWVLSPFGIGLDVCAPASPIWRALREHGDEQYPERTLRVAPSYGTSYSTALVAGMAALWISYHGRQMLIDRYGHNVNWAFRSVLRGTARRPNNWPRHEFGAGIPNAHAMMQARLPTDVSSTSVNVAANNRRILLGRFNAVWDSNPRLSDADVDAHAQELHLQISYQEYRAAGQVSADLAPPPISKVLSRLLG